jgi:translocator protein
MKKRAGKKRKIAWGLLILCFIFTYGIGFLGSLFTSPNVNTDWYNSVKPTITPPNIVFPIVWNILFFMIAVSLYLALTRTKDKSLKLKIWIAFGVNLLLNLLWSVFYFGLKNPSLAFFEVIFLEISIFAAMYVVWKPSKVSYWLLVPYSLWVGFAATLNYLSAFVH